jgi:nitrogen-specific signal transduction histidine kinase/CheY-like chemotaxis protein
VACIRLLRSVRQARGLAESRSVALAQLSAARDAAEQANHAKSEFVSRISHELRTPLNAILGFAQLIETEAASPRETDEARQIIRAATHLTAVVDDLLDLGSAERGELRASLESVSATEVLMGALELATPLVAERGLDLEVDAHGGMYQYVVADFQRLRQVLLNLISNAIKYNAPRGRIVVSFEAPDPGRLRFVITDTGAGIAPGDLGRMFDPFVRLEADAGREPGTGLGLAVSRSMIEAMGGTIGVTSAPGAGTSFHVDLATTAAPPSGTTDDVPAADDPVAVRALAPPATILCIEDNPANVRLIEGIFARQPQLRLLTALQGAIGVELAQRHRPDLVLLDVNLPDLSGEEVLARLRASPETASTPVLVVSADATGERRRTFLQAGAVGYVAKPLEVTSFMALVTSVLRTAASAPGTGADAERRS